MEVNWGTGCKKGISNSCNSQNSIAGVIATWGVLLAENLNAVNGLSLTPFDRSLYRSSFLYGLKLGIANALIVGIKFPSSYMAVVFNCLASWPKKSPVPPGALSMASKRLRSTEFSLKTVSRKYRYKF